MNENNFIKLTDRDEVVNEFLVLLSQISSLYYYNKQPL